MRLVREHPGLGVEAVAEIRVVDDVARRAGARVVEVHAHFPGIDVHDPVHEVHVVLEQVLGRVDRDDRLERGQFRAAIWIELNPPQEMPNMPTLPFDQACFDSQSITTSPSACSMSEYS